MAFDGLDDHTGLQPRFFSEFRRDKTVPSVVLKRGVSEEIQNHPKLKPVRAFIFLVVEWDEARL